MPSVHIEAIEQAKLLGVSKSRLLEMIEFAAPVTDDRGDWRYEDYILDVRDGHCYGIWEKDNPLSPEVYKLRPCVYCDQEGCITCHDTGKVHATISQYIDMQADAAVET